MGQDYQKEMDTTKSRRVPGRFLVTVLLVVVATNIVFLYAMTSYYQPNSSTGAKLSDSLLHKLINASRDEVLLNAEKELVKLRAELKSLHQGTERVILDRTQQIWEELMARPLTCDNSGGPGQPGVDPVNNPWMDWAKGAISRELKRYVQMRSLPLGWSSTLLRDTVMSTVGHGCPLLKQDMDKYMDYKVGKACPDDESLTQKLLVGGCEPLPRRRCFARTPKNYTEPYPMPYAMWTSPQDNAVIWTAHTCKNFECLRSRVKTKTFADCLDCFALEGRESGRWVTPGGSLDFTIDEVLGYKNGTIRIGLDIGGGTGSFAVRMRERDVTIVTTTLNLNGPFNNFVAARGVVPIYMTISQRFPFFDNTLDIVHSMHVLSNWIPTESLEFILYDIQRILRPGGLFWLDHFFCVKSELATFVPLIEGLGYNKLRWEIGDKVDRGRELEEVYICALLEKPLDDATTSISTSQISAR